MFESFILLTRGAGKSALEKPNQSDIRMTVVFETGIATSALLFR